MPNFRRNYVPGGTYFFTVVTQRRSRFLTEQESRKYLRDAILDEMRDTPFQQVAFVLLPDYFHALWTLPTGDSSYSLRIKRIKESFTRAHLASGGLESKRSERKIAKGERGVWQPRFWEHTVRNADDFKRCLDYIHWNPVKHGYVARTCDYPWSTFRKFVELGEYEPLWGTGVVVADDVAGAEWE